METVTVEALAQIQAFTGIGIGLIIGLGALGACVAMMFAFANPLLSVVG